MRRLTYSLPALAATACTGSSVTQLAALQPGTSAMQEILTKARATPEFAAKFAAAQALPVEQWLSASRSGLPAGKITLNGTVFEGLQNLVPPADMGTVAKGIQERYGKIGNILRTYGAPRTASVSAAEVDDYLQLATAGLKFAKSKSFNLETALQPTDYLRTLNVALALHAASQGTPHAATIAAATTGFTYAIYGVMKKEQQGSSLALLQTTTPIPTPTANTGGSTVAPVQSTSNCRAATASLDDAPGLALAGCPGLTGALKPCPKGQPKQAGAPTSPGVTAPKAETPAEKLKRLEPVNPAPTP